MLTLTCCRKKLGSKTPPEVPQMSKDGTEKEQNVSFSALLVTSQQRCGKRNSCRRGHCRAFLVGTGSGGLRQETNTLFACMFCICLSTLHHFHSSPGISVRDLDLSVIGQNSYTFLSSLPCSLAWAPEMTTTFFFNV